MDNYKLSLRRLGYLGASLLCLFATTTYGQSSAEFERTAKAKMDEFFAGENVQTVFTPAGGLGPNDASGSAMVPTGFGGSGFNIFGGIGGAYPQVYVNKGDLAGSVGVCIGDPKKFVNLAVSANIMDVSAFDNFSGNVIVSRSLGKGNSISVGAMNLFPNKQLSDYGKNTYYVAVSHAVQSMPSKTPGASKLTYGIGVGNGRFYDKSPLDIATGKGEHGTAVFANISYEIFQHVNVNAEWTGLNLGFSVGMRPLTAPLNLSVGVTNVTRYSGDQASILFSFGYPLSLTK